MTNRSTTASALAVSLPWQDRSIAGSEAEVSEAVSAAEASGEAVSEAEEPVASSDRHTDFESNTYFIYKEDNENKEMDDRRHSHGVHGSFKQLFIQQDGRERLSCVYSLE